MCVRVMWEDFGVQSQDNQFRSDRSYLTSFDDHINRKNEIPHIDESKKCQELSYIRVICDYILVGVNMDNNFEENGELNFFFLCEGSDT